MSKVSRRSMLKISTPTVLCSLFGGSVIGQTDNNEKAFLNRKCKIAVFGAHPDDPETGCGGTMALLANEGHEVISAYLTRGEAGIKEVAYDEAAKIRTAEALEACEILNATPKFLGQIDGNCEVTKEHYKAISDFFEEEKPDIVFNHWPIDRHRDHRACSILVYDAWYNLGRKSVMYYYEVMSGRQSQNFNPTDYVDITPVIDQKHKACYEHKSQEPEKWYQESHGQMEIFRGLEYRTQYAEAFVRHVQSPNSLII